MSPSTGRMLLGLSLAATLGGTACSFKYSPCAEGGDVTWDPPIVGNMECHQRRPFVRSDGASVGATDSPARVNVGRFRQWYASGRLALDGAFVDGKRDGTWTFYDEKGNPVRARTYVRGVERTVTKEEARDEMPAARASAPVLQTRSDHGSVSAPTLTSPPPPASPTVDGSHVP